MERTNHIKVFKTNAVKYKLVKEPTILPRIKINSSEAAENFIRPAFEDVMTISERFIMITLNNSHNVVGYRIISEGGLTGTLVDIRLIAKYALDSLAVAIIICHNHPSGTLHPSNSDIDLTKKIVAGMKTLDITVLDHLILTEDSYVSFTDKGLI